MTCIARRKSKNEIVVPPAHDWRTTDQDEINKRRLRARNEPFRVSCSDHADSIFTNFRVQSPSGLAYAVEIRDLSERQFACECVDFRSNGLGTCKHVEAVLWHLAARHPRRFEQAQRDGSPRIDIVPDPERLRIERNPQRLPAALRKACQGEPEPALAALERARVPLLRISQEVGPWLEARQRAAERKRLRHEYETKVHAGEWPA